MSARIISPVKRPVTVADDEVYCLEDDPTYDPNAKDEFLDGYTLVKNMDTSEFLVRLKAAWRSKHLLPDEILFLANIEFAFEVQGTGMHFSGKNVPTLKALSRRGGYR